MTNPEDVPRTMEELLLAALEWARSVDCGCCSRGELPDDPQVRALIQEVDGHE